MPIRNSKVPSAELFAKRRARRLRREEPGGDDGTGATTGQAEVADPAPTGRGEDTQRPFDTSKEINSPREERAEIAPEGKGAPPEMPDDATQEDGASASEEPLQSEDRVRSHAGRKRQFQKSDRTNAPSRKETGAMKLHMRVAVPAPGASPTFDQLVKIHGERPAFRLVLGKALEIFAGLAVDGRSDEAPLTYPESSTVIATARNIPKDAYAILTEEMNPKGLVSHRMMGTAIGRRALAAFVAEDKEQG